MSSDQVPGGGTGDPPARLREGLSQPGLDVRTRSRRDGRDVEAVVTFDSVAALCDAEILRRECSFRRNRAGGFDLTMTIQPMPSTAAPAGAEAEIRVRTAGRITAHNSDGRLQRGNVLSWTRTLDEFRGGGVEIRVRTDGTSVFAATARIVLRSALIAFSVVGVGLAALVLEGRRRLRGERRAAG